MKFEITPGNEKNDFEAIAESLINNYFLKVNDTEIELCDLEFYWNDKVNHNDENTHLHDYDNGQLRPHASGYDIALKNNNGYGGILIRGVIQSGEPTYGPIRFADVIFKAGGNLLSEESLTISLEERENPKSYPIFSTKRVGLNKETYIAEPYRFISYRADYLCEVEQKTALCVEIKQSNGPYDLAIVEKAIKTPRRKNNKS